MIVSIFTFLSVSFLSVSTRMMFLTSRPLLSALLTTNTSKSFVVVSYLIPSYLLSASVTVYEYTPALLKVTLEKSIVNWLVYLSLRATGLPSLSFGENLAVVVSTPVVSPATTP